MDRHAERHDEEGAFATTLGSDPNNPLDPPFDRPYWLGVTVGADPEMTPRFELTSGAYAIRSELAEGISNNGDVLITADADNTGNDVIRLRFGPADALRLEPSTTPPNVPSVIGGYSVTGGAPGATIGGGGQATSVNQAGYFGTVSGGHGNSAGVQATVGGGSTNSANGTDSTIAGGSTNTASAQYSTIGGGASNIAGGQYSAIVGGQGHTASGDWTTVAEGNSNIVSGQHSTIGGGRSNQVTGQHATVGGGRSNRASADYATVSGGGESTVGDGQTGNRVYDNYGAIGGGGNNVAGVDDADTTNQTYATVGGGLSNTASGWQSTVVGGESNTASGARTFIGGGSTNNASNNNATIGGGSDNMASGDTATIGGGTVNTASGNRATVPGGDGNTAAGARSLAAGRRAKANHDGAFVWADNTDADFASTAANQFLIRAAGGVGIGTTAPGQMLTVAGTIESTSGGIKIPDGTTQTTAATGGSGVPSGAVMFFNLSACPSGWSPLAAGVGRYVVGVTNGAEVGVTAGTALSSGENRPAGHHYHALHTDKNDAFVAFSTTWPGMISAGPHVDPNSKITAISEPTNQEARSWHYANDNPGATNEAAETGGVAGTPAPYLQLLVCQKD